MAVDSLRQGPPARRELASEAPSQASPSAEERSALLPDGCAVSSNAFNGDPTW